jgi:hypothetical protein
VGKYPNWDRPKLTETQKNGEEKRLSPRNLFPEDVRADLIRALASMNATSVGAACRELSGIFTASDSLIENCLNGRMPLYDVILTGLYGPGRGSSLPLAWTNPTDFGPLTDHAFAVGLIDSFGFAAANLQATPTPVSPDPDAGALSSPGAPPASVIVAQATTPQPSDDLPAAPATPISRAAPDAAPESAAPPAFFSDPVSLPAPSPWPVQLREVSAADHSPPPAPIAADPLTAAERIMAGRLAAALEEAEDLGDRYAAAMDRVSRLRFTVAELVAARVDDSQDRAAA